MARRRNSRRHKVLFAWLAVLAALWVGQLGLIWWDLGRNGVSGWDRFRMYWGWRRAYRPAIRLVEASSGIAATHLNSPAVAFHPLSTTAARQAFVVCTGVYAAGATLVLYGGIAGGRRMLGR